jgi:hypothetical protein
LLVLAAMPLSFHPDRNDLVTTWTRNKEGQMLATQWIFLVFDQVEGLGVWKFLGQKRHCHHCFESFFFQI